jgi:hypothetical protein
MVKKLEKKIDTFDDAKPRFLSRGKKRRSVSTLSPSVVLGALSLPKGIPRVLVLSTVEGADRGVEWVDLTSSNPFLSISSFDGNENPCPLPTQLVASFPKAHTQH